ncbi:hypothetical protein ACFS5J_06635 [Flavobacterium chuncheonense]|uniref:Uncharacterized protein n=1 Tax=Flavobacterium chuncheonense TaxID=2026653 RepID=A0ABW5YLQ0_9FLAO
MKKIFLFLAVAGSAFMTSCSDDDSSSTPTPDPVATAITLSANATTLELGAGSFTLSVANDLGANVTATSTYYVNDAAIASNVFTPSAEGTYVIHATNGTLVSNDVTVTVTAATAALNNIIYNGSEYAVNNTAVVFWGGYNADPNATTATHALWSNIAFVGTQASDLGTTAHYLDIEFLTPLNSDGTVALPTTSNVIYLDIYEMKLNGADVDVTAQTAAGNLVLAANLDPANDTTIAYTLTGVMIGSNALSLDFDGTLLGVFDESNKSADAAAVFAAHNKVSRAEVTQKVKSFIASRR